MMHKADKPGGGKRGWLGGAHETPTPKLEHKCSMAYRKPTAPFKVQLDPAIGVTRMKYQ